MVVVSTTRLMKSSRAAAFVRTIPLVAVALLAAGCTGAPTQSAAVEGVIPELPDIPPLLAEIISVIDPAGGHGEPSFGVAPDGTLFANGDSGQSGGVYRSADGGLTWEFLGAPTAPMPNFDPDLAVSRDGTVWFSSLYIACTSTAASADLGETWTANLAACNTVAADRQYVVPTEGGTAFLYSHQLPTFYQMAAKTTDYGKTWVPTAPVEFPDHFLPANGGTGWGGGGFWNAAKDSVFFTWSYTGPEGRVPGFAVTRDEGASWIMGTAPGAGGEALGLGLVVGAADEAGNVYLAWGETKGDGTAIYLSTSTDDGDSWSAPKRVDDGTPGSRVFPAITAGAPGKVAIAYYESADDAYPDAVEGAWNVTLAYTNDALVETPLFEHGILNVEPVKEGGICISGTSCTGDREFADYFQIHVLPDGRVGAIFNMLSEDKLIEVYAATKDALLGSSATALP